MRIKKTIRTFAMTVVLALAATPVMGQDLLARQAPIDRKMKAVDTVALRHIIQREQAQSLSSQLYTEWSNKYAHRATTLPDSFKIDLRGFHMPTPSRVITSNFGRRWGRMHKGLDIKVYIGDTIRAAFDGKVRVANYEAAGYGNYVVIRHNNGLETIYGHMSKRLVGENEPVKAGDPIGLGGNTGRSTGSHLHFETRLCGVALDPALMFDFKNQDVTADYYMFRNNNAKRRTTTIARNTMPKTEAQDVPVIGEPNEQTAVLPTAKKPIAKAQSKASSSHKVKKGETLYSIAKQHGMTVDQLRKVNRLGKSTNIKVGQVLRFS
jgi:murein DD-endopeptidase MepM/ murein hydrolase activator NlpD